MLIKFYPIQQIKYEKTLPKAAESSVTFGASGVAALDYLSSVSTVNKADIAAKQYKEHFFFCDFLTKEGKVTREEYKDIIKNHPSVISKAREYVAERYTGICTPSDVAENTLRVDKYFKQIFGGDFQKYRIISIGTSPSPITEQLANMGHNVVFLPVSGVRFGYKEGRNRLGNSSDFRALMQYLDTKDIDDGKFNVVLDFTSSGTTLDVMKKLINEYFGFKDKNISKVSLGDNILDYYYDGPRNNYIQDSLDSKIERISNVPHFPVTTGGFKVYNHINDDENTIFFDKRTPKKEIFEKFESYSSPLARAFALCTMAELDKKMQNPKYSAGLK